MFKYVLVKDLPNSESNIHANKSVLFYVLQSENNVMDTSCFTKYRQAVLALIQTCS